MRARAFLSALASVPLLAACSFLLDFNGLQGEHKAASDAGRDASSSDAEAGSGGANVGSDAGGAGVSNG